MHKMNKLSFFLNFLSDPRIGTFAATPQKVVKKVCGRIDFSKDIVVTEYGPGDGPYTRHLLDKMTPKSRLIAIETNKNFEAQLKKIDDDRLIIIKDDARYVLRILHQNGFQNVDYVISGIPFSCMDQQSARVIICDTYGALKPGGKFLIYQFSSSVKKYLTRYFTKVSVKLELGLPYYLVFEAWK
jgi:phosphatidylethanolamine/phosphatidyl-N-methylethanolamine N-methyltransferase